jgi:chromosome segregation ATPase
MSEGERSIALTTACDDLQAQLEAGDRSVRHLDHDLSELRQALAKAFAQAETLGNLHRHMSELRAHMREQRQALREVRRAAYTLSCSIAQTREGIAALAEQTSELERSHAELAVEVLAGPRRLAHASVGGSGPYAVSERDSDPKGAITPQRQSHATKSDPTP